MQPTVRSLACLALPLVLASAATAQTPDAGKKPAPQEGTAPAKPPQDKANGDKPAPASDEKKPDAPADASAAAPTTDEQKPDNAVDNAPPAGDDTPPLPTDTPPLDATGTPTPAKPGPGAQKDTPPPEDTPADLEQLKAQLKEELKAELKEQLEADLDAAARDAASQRAAKIEWEEERWVEEVKPKLNFLEINGYFRTRIDLFNRLSLGTYDPILGRGTSGAPTPTLYRPFDGENGCDDNDFEGTLCEVDPEDTNTHLTMNMRLRLEPTLNVSEDIRIRSTLDVFDNLVLGSTPESKPGFANNPTLPLPLFAASQNVPQEGLNTFWDPIRLRRLWAEIMTPFGQLRVGRQPQNFGLGLLVNDGNGIDNDFGDNADQILFATRIKGIYLVPGYSISSAGPVGRGGGAGAGGDGNIGFFQAEQGQRYNLDPRDDVHTFIFTVVKRDSPEDIAAQLKTGWPVINGGVFGAYRRQDYDIPDWYAARDPLSPATIGSYVRRNANVGVASGWLLFQWYKFKFEAEMVGIVGHVANTSVTSGGINAVDEALVDAQGNDLPLWIIQGGAAFESSYTFLNDSLVVGFDGGVATGDDAPGFGLRSTINQNPQQGDFDGKQYGQCISYNEEGECENVDNNITNFRFDPGYNVDLLLFREVMGTVTDAWYVKPNISYYLTPNIGVRGDMIYSQAIFANSTPGQYLPMGLEFDGKAFYGSDDGLYTMIQGGFLLPFGAFNHAQDPNLPGRGRDLGNGQRVNTRFLNAQFAYTVQGFVGVQF